jgi:glycosyltransferase involved in cell wall biosynthesis
MLQADGEPVDIVFVGHTAQVSGAEQVMLGLVDVAIDRGHHVSVACPTGPLSHALPDAARHVALPELGLHGESGVRRALATAEAVANWTRAARVLRHYLRDAHTRVIVNSLFALPAVRLATAHGKNVTWLVHDTLASTRQVFLARVGRRGVSRAVAVSEGTARPLKRLGYNVEVSCNGVRWPVEAAGIELHDPPVVGIMAALVPWKGHRVLLDAVAGIPDIHLDIAGRPFLGDEPYEAELRARAAEPDLAGRVRFLGHVEPLSTMRRWDVLASPSIEPEAGPLAVLEAMSLGIPVVCTRHAGYAYADAAVLVDPNDAVGLSEAIQRLIADETTRLRLSIRGRSRVADRHDMSKTLPQSLDRLIG